MNGNFVVLDTIINNTSRNPSIRVPALAGVSGIGGRDVLFGY